MKYEFEEKKINKEELLQIDEKDVMFITSPGRMGDVDGSTFVIKVNNKYVAYRVGTWGVEYKDNNYISFDDMLEHFPKWNNALKNCNKNKCNDKYIYVYMGFGNLLCVDKSIYDIYYPYLLEVVKKQDMYSLDENGDYNPCLNFPSWIPALENMINDGE